MMRRSRRMGGFTLVEAIIVITITGILGGVVALFMRNSVENYVDSAARAEMTDVADLALRRISRELRLALPNSIVVANNQRTLQFLITSTGGRYIDVADAPPATLLPLDFNPATASLAFNMAGAAPTGRQAIVPGNFITVFNVGVAPANAYTGGNIARVAAVNGTLITLASNPFAVASPSMPSPTNRFQVVTGTVTYVCTPAAGGAGNLTRFVSTNILDGTGTGALGTGALLANMVSGCRFDYSVLANTNAALVGVTLGLARANGENINLVRQVHVDNTP
jgi:MSHA biogenesis protein MshO